MSNTFKWLALKAGTALGRNVPSLFYQLIYREIYREIYELTEDGAQTVKLAFKLGYTAAEESAIRQAAVFRIFPSEPKKVLEYVPLLWHIYFGQPMEDYTMEWDLTEPGCPILKYKIKVDPLIFELGSDPVRDNLPWAEFWHENDGYGSMMAGLLTQCSSFVLRLKEKNERITLHNDMNYLHGDDCFEFTCQIIPSDRFPNYNLLDDLSEFQAKPIHDSPEMENTIQSKDLFTRLTQNIDIDQLDEMFADPAGMLRIPLKQAIEKGTKMDSSEFINHFTNDEDKFIQVIGFLSVHILNEVGQLPEKIFENETIAKIWGHIVLFIEANSEKFVPISIIQDFLTHMVKVFDGMAPETFVVNMQKIHAPEAIALYFKGVKRALADIGINFAGLKPSLYEEFLAKPIDPLADTPTIEEKKRDQDRLYSELTNQVMIISTAILSIPAQLGMMLAYKALSSSSHLISSLFHTIRESGQEIVDLVDQLQN